MAVIPPNVATLMGRMTMTPDLVRLVRELHRRPQRVRLSVSLDPLLIAWVKEVARRADVPVSHVVELALERYKLEAG